MDNNDVDDLKDIDEKLYGWSINMLRSVMKMLKVNVKLHADRSALEGDIFLCNHFSRFETLIPQFLIYEETGAYSCSIASAEFFKDDSLLADYLHNMGVIPHNHPNLFANLARQIFLGRKVIIFPEGGMVKDHRVLDQQGNYSIYSRITGERRKQHTGAAVLAQGIEAFKTIVRNAYCAKNYAQLLQWQQDLQLDSLEQLLTTALKPTIIIPANITFYPIRSTENLLLKSAEFFAKGLSTRQTEELLVEGNILLKDTDMDLRMGKPVDPRDTWHWWNRYALNMVATELQSLDATELQSLDAIFSVYAAPKNWKQKLLGHYFRRSAKATRNQYMEKIYANLTINLSHLASTLILYCIECDQQKIDKQHFYKTLYIAIKSLQNNHSIRLHRSLLNPDEYNNLWAGTSKRFAHFICIAENSELIATDLESYRFLPKLYAEFDFDSVRMENLIVVYSNEVAPVTVVKEALVLAYQQSANLTDKQLAVWMFHDEIISLKWDAARYSKACYDDINHQETATASAQPFLLRPKKGNGIGVVLVHGLLASPAELKDYADMLFQQGYTVFGVRLKGHGTSPYDLRAQSGEDWFASVQRGLQIINIYCEMSVLIGFSTGGTLALKLAAENPEKVQAVVGVSVPVKFVDKTFAFVPLLHGTNKLLNWVSSMEGVKPFVENEQEHKLINYKHVPVKSLYELRRLISDVGQALPAIKIPTLIIYADEDPVVQAGSAEIVFNGLTVKTKELISVHADRHGILMENIGGTWESIDKFLQKNVLAKRGITQ